MTLPDAGWFPDPQNADRLRWWDGRMWSEATQAAPTTRPSRATATLMEAHPAPAFSVSFGADQDDPAGSTDAWNGAADAWRADGAGWAEWSEPPRRVCLFSWAAGLLAVAAIVANPYGVVAACAIVFAIIGLVRPRSTGRWRAAARSVALSALVLAIATTLVAVNGVVHVVPL